MDEDAEADNSEGSIFNSIFWLNCSEIVGG